MTIFETATKYLVPATFILNLVSPSSVVAEELSLGVFKGKREDAEAKAKGEFLAKYGSALKDGYFCVCYSLEAQVPLYTFVATHNVDGISCSSIGQPAVYRCI